jgi:hypothetical protein
VESGSRKVVVMIVVPLSHHEVEGFGGCKDTELEV